MEDYLKVIYGLDERGNRITTQAIAERLDVAAPSVTGMLKRLADINLIEHERYRSIELTDAGRKVALEVVRHHRLLELYLAEALGYSWDEVHDEADRLEHLISEEFERRIDAALGHPTFDPHGDPIPTIAGDVSAVPEDRLSTLEPGDSATVVRVSDKDAEKLRYLGSLGLYPEADVTVIERMPFNGPLRVRVGDDEHVVGLELAASVHVHSTAADGESSNQV
ncbi:MAG: metal-dependent transcriptional regulator [Chloroflexia bacterium]|nr:metal-dependent transcriptional regulator [Chloroflexia bacterium]